MKKVNYNVLSTEKVNEVTKQKIEDFFVDKFDFSDAVEKEIHVDEFKYLDRIIVVETKEFFFIDTKNDCGFACYEKKDFTLDAALSDTVYSDNDVSDDEDANDIEIKNINDIEDLYYKYSQDVETQYQYKTQAINLCKGREDVSHRLIREALFDAEFSEESGINSYVESIDINLKESIMNVLENMKHIDVDLLQEMLHLNETFSNFAIERLQNNPDLTIEKLEKWLYTEQEHYGTCDNITRERILSGICANRTDIPLEWYERELSEQEDCDVCLSAIKACKDRNDIPASLIETAKNHECEEVREAAEELMNSMKK